MITVQHFARNAIKILRSIRNRGLYDSVLYVFYEFYFDFKFKVETRKPVELSDITDVSSTAKISAQRYKATPYYFLRQSLSKVAQELQASDFLDYGCGKGRALLLAAELGAKAVYGVEYSERLCRTCRENLSRAGKDQNAWVICQDAGDFVVPPSVNVIFLFNPFNEDVLRKVVVQINNSLELVRRKVTVVYHNPEHEDLFFRSGFCKVDEIMQRNQADRVSILSYTPQPRP